MLGLTCGLQAGSVKTGILMCGFACFYVFDQMLTHTQASGTFLYCSLPILASSTLQPDLALRLFIPSRPVVHVADTDDGR